MHIERTPILSLLRRGALAGLLGLLGAGVACQPGAPQPSQPATAVDSDEPLLRTYTVPPEHTRAIRRALQSALANGKDLPPHGTIEELPNGQLVVVAPVGIHDGIAELIRGLDANRAPPVHTAMFDYWVVVGESGAEGGLDVPELAPALAAIVRAQGPMKFTLLDQAHVATLIDESAKVQGSRLEVRHVVTEVGGRLIADVDLDIDTAAEFDPDRRCAGGSCKNFRTRVHVNPGQLLVIGQTGLASAAGTTRNLFFLVRGTTMAGE